MRRFLVVGAAMFVGLAGAFATNAASPGKIQAVTHSSNHADTTSNAGPCTLASDNGPVWAYDNLSFQLTATPESGPGNYSVTITANGSFDAFANPNTGDCYTKHGSVDGWLTFDVQSSVPPSSKNLPSQVSGSMSQGAILNEFFGGNATIVGGGHYSYTYTQIDGSKYVQAG